MLSPSIIRHGTAGRISASMPKIPGGASSSPLPNPASGATTCGTISTFQYRGFDLALIPFKDGFEVVLLNKGNPIKINWSNRTRWHSPRRARIMAKQYIRHTFTAKHGLLASHLEQLPASAPSTKSQVGLPGPTTATKSARWEPPVSTQDRSPVVSSTDKIENPHHAPHSVKSDVANPPVEEAKASLLSVLG